MSLQAKIWFAKALPISEKNWKKTCWGWYPPPPPPPPLAIGGLIFSLDVVTRHAVFFIQVQPTMIIYIRKRFYSIICFEFSHINHKYRQLIKSQRAQTRPRQQPQKPAPGVITEQSHRQKNKANIRYCPNHKSPG